MRMGVAILVALVALLAVGQQAQAFTILGTGTPALLGGDLTDPEDDINDNVPSSPNGGANYNWVSSAASGENWFSPGVGSQAALDLFDNKASGGETKWCCSGPPQWVALDLGSRYVLTHFTAASGNDADYRRPTEWSIDGSNDGVDWTTIFAHVGSSVWDANNQVIQFDTGVDFGAPDPHGYSWFRYSVTDTVGGTQHQLNEIELFGELVPEPATVSLLGIGALALLRRRRRA